MHALLAICAEFSGFSDCRFIKLRTLRADFVHPIQSCLFRIDITKKMKVEFQRPRVYIKKFLKEFNK